jgi:hypothetical protein
MTSSLDETNINRSLQREKRVRFAAQLLPVEPTESSEASEARADEAMQADGSVDLQHNLSADEEAIEEELASQPAEEQATSQPAEEQATSQPAEEQANQPAEEQASPPAEEQSIQPTEEQARLSAQQRDAERIILERKLPSQAPLQSAMRRSSAFADEDGDVGRDEKSGSAQEDEEDAQRANESDADDRNSPSDGAEEDEDNQPLLPAFEGAFSSSDDSQVSPVGVEEFGLLESEDSDSKEDSTSARDCESEEDDEESADRSTAQNAVDASTTGKRKREGGATKERATDETKMRRQALHKHKAQLKAKDQLHDVRT